MNKSCCTMGDFGISNCNPEWGAIIGGIFYSRKGSNNSINAFSINDGLSIEGIKSIFSNQDPRDRFHSMPLWKNVVPTKAESKTVESSNGSLVELYEGKRSFEVELWEGDGTPTLKGKLDSLKCGKNGIFFLTANGFMIGFKSVDSSTLFPLFLPIPIDEKSVRVNFNFQTDDAPRKIMFAFDLERNFKDETIYAIDCNELYSTTSLSKVALDLTDLPQVVGANMKINYVSVGLSTMFSVSVNDDFRQGAFTSGVDQAGNVTGLTITEFALLNKTSGNNLILSSVTEIPSGTYLMDVSNQTSGDTLELSLLLDPSKDLNYSGSQTILIP